VTDDPIGGPRIDAADEPTVIADYPDPRTPEGGPASAYADRALLFGVLALALDLVSRDHLVAGLHAWAANKTQTLGEVLRGQGVLDAQKQELVDALIQKHLAKHNGIPRRGLAAVALSAPVRAALEAVADPEVRSALAVTRSEPAAAAAAPSAGASSRYRVLRPLAEGGLGAVFVAEDAELPRQVALKQIQPGPAADPGSRERFVLEAEVTGGLEHPGIVPVYGLGTGTDGRPFYAMRLVRGETFSAGIERFRRSGADFGGLACRELLGRFVDACQAVAYAHSRGVLHRDLKPASVMLGKFGETLVIDWGLAQPTGRSFAPPGEAEPPLVPRADAESSSVTVGALGTPAYASPEQAAGRIDGLGPETDVFGLGAILYEMLTGQAPYLGGDRTVPIRQPRRLNPAVPAALEAVCRKALAAEPARRYRSALGLATDVERWLAGEPVAAWKEPRRARARRWLRKHGTMVTSAAVLLGTAALVLAAGLVAAGRERVEAARRERAEADATRVAAVADVEKVRDERDAEAQAKREAVEQGRRERERAEAARREAEAGAERARAERDAQEQVRRDAEAARDAEADARRRTREAVAALAGDTVEKLLARSHPLGEGDRRLVRQIHGVFEESAREAPAAPEARAALAHGLFRVAALRQKSGEPAEAERAYRDALALQAKLAADVPAVPEHRRALALTDLNLGHLLYGAGRLPEAEQSFRDALALQAKLATEFPAVAGHRADLAASQLNLGNLLIGQGRSTEAEPLFRAALALQAKLAADFPAAPGYRHELALTHLNLGNLLSETGRPGEAERSFRAALALCQALATEFPADPGYRADLAASQLNLGNVLYGAGRPEEAERSVRAALAQQERLAAEFPAHADYRNDLAGSLVYAALVARGRGDFARARTLLERARPHHAAALASNPRHPVYRQFFRNNVRALAATLADLGEPAAAAREADTLAGLGVDPAGDALDAARTLARCAALAAKGDKGMADSYAGRAVALLRQSVARGGRNMAGVLRDGDFGPLRGRADYAELLWDLAETSPAGGRG
jgi:tetratricopeptide (TPR) repeat protein